MCPVGVAFDFVSCVFFCCVSVAFPMLGYRRKSEIPSKARLSLLRSAVGVHLM